MRFLASSAVFFVIVIVFFFAAPGLAQQAEEHMHSNAVSGEGLGRAHMDISCFPSDVAKFDRALALLHNFWYAWDSPSQADETAAWTLVQKGMSGQKASAREKLYLAAVAALYKDAGAGSKSARDQNYRDAMAAVYAQYPDDENALFYGLSVLGAVPEGSQGFEQQGQAAKLFEAVYASHPDHPGVLHYLIHAYDDPEHAQLGLKAARAYAQVAAAVPHALHMPAHIFTRLGYWEESAATTLKGLNASLSSCRRYRPARASRRLNQSAAIRVAFTPEQ